MKILGINHDMFITSAALISDGKIISAILRKEFPEKSYQENFLKKPFIKY